MKTIRSIESYLEGKLSEDEKKTFEAKLEKDKEFQSLVFLHEEINEAIFDQEIVDFREQISELLPEKTSHKSKVIPFITGIAASVIIALSIISITMQPDYEKAYQTYYQPYETDINVRSANNKTEGLNFALLLYEKGEFEASFEILENYNKSVFDNDNARFYYGLCALELGKVNIAEESFLQAIESQNIGIQLHAKWYLILTYLKAEQPDKAKPYVIELSENKNFYSEKVGKIKKKYY